MNIERIFRMIPEFQNIKMGRILFESYYPIIFTCEDEGEVYLFICCLNNSREIVWIGSKTSYGALISLLKNEISIRDAFLSTTKEKEFIKYIKGKVCHNKTDSIPYDLLPTEDQFMDAEDGEFSEEIDDFERKERMIGL